MPLFPFRLTSNYYQKLQFTLCMSLARTSPLGPSLAPGGPVGLKAGGLPGQTDALPLGNRVRWVANGRPEPGTLGTSKG